MTTTFPATGSLTLTDASVPRAVREGALSGALERVDITIADGRIVAIGPPGSAPPGGPTHDMRGGLVLPAFVDIHTHLDKGHIWPRTPNPDGTWEGAIEVVATDRAASWSALDMRRRMQFALASAHAHGTAAIRTHLDSGGTSRDSAWDVFDAVRAQWAGRIELQAVALVGPDILLDKAALRAVAERARQSNGLLGGSLRVHEDSRRAMLSVVEMAGETGLDLDLHADETLAPESSALLHLAEAVIETGYRGRVLAGHCCVLSVQPERQAMATIDKVAEAGISVVSLPMCNMYLQDRQCAGVVRTPRHRGVTLVKELRAAGVKVALASDNTRDPFYAYGDLDALEVLREGARIAQFDHPEADAFDWLRSVTTTPATIAGFAHKGQIAVGALAELVLVTARNWTELNARPQADRIVLRAGRPIDTSLPDYRELDDLME